MEKMEWREAVIIILQSSVLYSVIFKLKSFVANKCTSKHSDSLNPKEIISAQLKNLKLNFVTKLQLLQTQFYQVEKV